MSLDSFQVKKDSDLGNFTGNMTPYAHYILMEKLTRDVRFLEDHNIMDYSLLVNICKPVSTSYPFLFHNDEFSFCIGIIDFLQQFTHINQTELKLKSILKNSSPNPTNYAERILKNIQDYITVIN